MPRPILVKGKKATPTPPAATPAEATEPLPEQIVVQVDGEVCELSPGAFPIWKKCREALDRVGCLDDVDNFLLVRYAEHFAEWIKLSADIRKGGTHEKLVSNKGKTYFSKRPECSRIEYLERAMLSEERELGISRKSRRNSQGASRKTGTEKEHDTFFRERK